MTPRSTCPALALALALSALAGAAAAQDVTLPPSYGEMAFATGQMATPATVSLVAGGDIFVDIGGCSGYVAQAPDFRVFYSATAPSPLSFVAESQMDTVLVINAPDGSWHCSDDFYGFDPALNFGTPLSGQYDIWVGTYDAGAYPPASLIVAEFWLN